MDISNEVKGSKSKFLILLASLISVLGLSVYSSFYGKTDLVYTHLYYIIILMMAFWFKRYLMYMAIFLGTFHIAVSFFSSGIFLLAPLLRAIVLLLVSTVIFVFRNEASEYYEALEKIFRGVGEGVIVVDPEKKVFAINRYAEQITGWNSAEAKGKNIHEVFSLSPENEEFSIQHPFDEVFETDSVFESSGQVVIMAADGHKMHTEYSAYPIKDINGRITGGVLIFRNIAEEEKNKQLEYLRSIDILTGLYNRQFFEKEIRNMDSERFYPLSIIMLDINEFSALNNKFGNYNGDEILKYTAETIKKCCR